MLKHRFAVVQQIAKNEMPIMVETMDILLTSIVAAFLFLKSLTNLWRDVTHQQVRINASNIIKVGDFR
jgi:hypothetical protein